MSKQPRVSRKNCAVYGENVMPFYEKCYSRPERAAHWGFSCFINVNFDFNSKKDPGRPVK